MRERNQKVNKKRIASKKSRTDDRAHEFETMSQIQNRYGNGREKNGSDGSSTQGRGSNH